METSAHDIAMHSRNRIADFRVSSLDKKHQDKLSKSADAATTTFVQNDGLLFDTALGQVDLRVREMVSEATIMGLLKERMLADFGSNIMVRGLCPSVGVFMFVAWQVSKDADLRGICSTSFASEAVFNLLKEVHSMLANGQMTLSAHICKKVTAAKRKEPAKDASTAPAIQSIKKARGATKFQRQNKSKPSNLASVTFAASSQLDARVTNSISPENMGFIFNVRDQSYLHSVLKRITTKELTVKEVITGCRNRCAHAWLYAQSCSCQLIYVPRRRAKHEKVFDGMKFILHAHASTRGYTDSDAAQETVATVSRIVGFDVLFPERQQFELNSAGTKTMRAIKFSNKVTVSKEVECYAKTLDDHPSCAYWIEKCKSELERYCLQCSTASIFNFFRVSSSCNAGWAWPLLAGWLQENDTWHAHFFSGWETP